MLIYFTLEKEGEGRVGIPVVPIVGNIITRLGNSIVRPNLDHLG